jgi:chromate transporter
MEDEVVTRRRWLSREEFLDYLGATNLIPGPNSTELAIHVGLARHGMPGLLVAGACFILPAVIIVTIIAWAYARFGTLPAVVAAFHGVTPVVLAVIAQALWKLGRSAVKSPALGVIAALSVAALAAGANELVVLAAAGVAAALSARILTRAAMAVVACRVLTPAISAEMFAAAVSSVPFSLWGLFATFAKLDRSCSVAATSSSPSCAPISSSGSAGSRNGSCSTPLPSAR